MKNAVQKYLEEQIKTDEALAKVYDSAKLDDCIKYLNKLAEKRIPKDHGNCVCIPVAPEDLYHWARDFYFGDFDTSVTVEKVEEKTGIKTVEAEEIQEETPIKKMTIQKIIQNDETEKQYITRAELDQIMNKNKAPKKKKEDIPVDDGQLCFEF